MKRTLLLSVAIIVLMAFQAFSQNNFHNRHILDPYNPEYAEGVVLIKFKDEIKVEANVKRNSATTGLQDIDQVLEKYEASDIKKLFKAEKQTEKRYINNPKGGKMEVPQLFNIYKLEFSSKTDAKEIAEELATDPAVEYAEPDYFVYTMDVIPDDPLYQDGSQWYIDAVNAPAAWDSAAGAGQVIGIIDTGVDWDHPDLDDNIWINEDEIPGNGIDDDGNGYVDDVRGWDFINNDNDPKDDNSHGTHVAGIAAGEGNNGVGIVGVAYEAKIMPVKMLQSSGTGNSSDLAAAIEYVYSNGGTILNMSLGSYAYSGTVENALINAYVNSILVAAAGNDGLCICNDCFICATIFPAGYPFVLGVQCEGDFSNFDPSGPIDFVSAPIWNYELTAPGVNIMSSIPNGYRSYSGTSMAAPIVSGICALAKSHNDTLWTDHLWSKLIFGSENGFVNAYNTLTLDLDSIGPDFRFIEYTLTDTLPGCDGDGRADAGETVQLHFTVKNVGGYADSAWVNLHFGEFEDTTTAVITDSTSYIGDISTWATLTSELSPIEIQIDSNVINNRDIVFSYELGCANCNDTISENLIVEIENGQELSGIMDSTLVLSANKLWLINESFRVHNTGILIIEPGAYIINNNGLVNYGQIIGTGTKDSLITIVGCKFSGNGNYHFEYTIFSGTGNFGQSYNSEGSGTFNYCTFSDINAGNKEYLFNMNSLHITNSTIKNCIANYNLFSALHEQDYYIYRNNIFDCAANSGASWFQGIDINNFNTFKYNNVVNIYTSPAGMYPSGFLSATNNISIDNHIQNAFIGFSSSNKWAIRTRGSNGIVSIKNQYWGTTKQEIIKEQSIYDFFDDPSLPMVDYSPLMQSPSNLALGCIWKVQVNDKNPLDEILDPLGSETVKFDVYFNRAMDTSYTPLVGFGVFEPYLQRVVDDSAHWSIDSTIWTAYYKIGPETGDGINTIHVRNARDSEGFEIPPEKYRFKFVIQAAGAQSIEFLATPGIGKVNLEWPPAETPDVLGYNLYRFYNLTDSTFSDTTMINAELILDTLYTDFEVIPDTTYHYLYTIIGTDMAESDYSKRVAATPFTAANGDANGDMAVNVLDITSIVSYMLNQNPQPFLFDAADVNGDDQINVLDIIGTVQIIMGTKSAPLSQLVTVNPEPAFIKLKENHLQLESKGQVAAMQFNLTCENPEQVKLLCKIPGFEMATGITGENNITGILYNFTQKAIPGGYLDLIKIESEQNQEISIGEVTGGDLHGDYVPILKEGEEIKLPETFNLSAQPNPFSSETRITFDLPEAARVQAEIFDISGKKVNTLINQNMIPGSHTINWNSRDSQGRVLPSGIYFLHFEATTKDESIVKDRKLVYMK